MWRLLICIIFACSLHYVVGYSGKIQLCGTNTTRRAQTRGCTTQILDPEYANYNDPCTVEFFPPNSAECKQMSFSPIEANAGNIGGVSLKPYILPKEHIQYVSNFLYSFNATVLNITFTNIKWKTMKFRFQQAKQNHCRNIVLSNDATINDQSVLYYDCYWSVTDGNYNGQSHILDFEATDDKVVNRGQYYFNIPSAQMLSPTISPEQWQPFLYIEILTGFMRLHINPPPSQIDITGYKIRVMKEADQGLQVEKITTMKLKNGTNEITYDYSLMYNGSYHYVVTPLHTNCTNGDEEGCQHVESPKIKITTDIQRLNVCIASITSLIVASLFIYYIALKLIRKYWCKDYIPAAEEPPKVLVVYSPASRLHTECITSFVNYIRNEYGIDMMYDGDIANTTHGDPFLWADEAFRSANHVIYVVGPASETNNVCSNIYDQPINPHRNIDTLILSWIKADRGMKNKKDVMNVFFDYSNGPVPVETKREKSYHLLKDWQKFIAYLSKNLFPVNQIKKCKRGETFLDDLNKAKKLLSGKQDNIC